MLDFLRRNVIIHTLMHLSMHFVTGLLQIKLFCNRCNKFVTNWVFPTQIMHTFWKEVLTMQIFKTISKKHSMLKRLLIVEIGRAHV